LGKTLVCLSGDAGEAAAKLGQCLFAKQQFVQGVLRELSVCLCRCNPMLEGRAASIFVKATFIVIMHGLTRPLRDVMSTDYCINFN
jgi:hypothetical protein